MAPLLAMALGGAAIGALANPKDRKKGALAGLGIGLLGPAAGAAMGAGTTAVAPVGMMAKMNAAAQAGLTKLGTMATSQTAKGLGKSAAEGAVGVGVQQALTPKQVQHAQTQSMAIQTPQQAPQSMYQQAAINTQNRMKRRGQPKKFI
jgi:hypothetical protein